MEAVGVINVPTYLIGTLIVILLPGPNSLFVLATAASRGVRCGYRAACGVFLGDAVLMAVASAGAASVLKAYPALFLLIKYAGAAYLAWIGVSLIRASLKGRAESPEAPAGSSLTEAAGSDPFHRALLISLLNPKAILFFVAFFVQFVDPAAPAPWAAFAMLGVIAQSFSFLYLSALIFSGSRLAQAFRRRRRLAAATTGSAGALFLGFGAKLATASLT